ncbi:MAG: Uma2 family endonuclease, partial [Desulfobacterales bacterium]|nr:Uma2 family endonuclease [Desulfobacterales bacterium]
MAEATLRQTTDEWPDISGLVTEDDTPVDNLFSEKQQRMLTESLNTSWKPGKPFMAVSDIAVFYDTDEPPVVPDVCLSLEVSPPEDVWKKRNRSYFLQEYGKPPEVAVEIVSNSEGEESGKKMRK